jgi:4-amino-4-deoxy-L-arabinose transferase-like glycosyltransferase
MSRAKIALPTDIAAPATRARAAARPWALWLTLVGIALGALLLRALTIRQSLPYVDHPDEPNPINYVVGMLRTGDPNQQFFQKPSLFVYLSLAAIQLHYRMGLAAGAYSDIAQMVVTTHTVTTLPGFFVVARLISAAFGALTALAAYSLGARGWGRGAGVVGALFVAALPYHLRFSQWATTDVTATFLATMSLGAALLAARDNRPQAYLVAGAFAGLAASAKYNAGAVVGAIGVAALLAGAELWRARRARLGQVAAGQLGRVALAGAAALACFVAGTPYALLSPDLVAGGVSRQWSNYGGANGHYRGAWNLAGYAAFFWYESLGPAGCLLTLAGLAIMALRRRPMLTVWLGFALPSLLVHLSRPTHFMQNMLPLLVACALPLGVAVTELPALLIRRAPRLGRAAWARPLVAGGLLAALLVPHAAGVAQHLGRQAAGDSRLQLLDWIGANVPPGARMAAELKPVPGQGEARWTDVEWLPQYDLAWYRAQGYAYLVGSSNAWRQFSPPAAYDALGGEPAASFGPIRREDMLGPRLVIWDTGLSAADAPLQLGEVRVGAARLAGVSLGDPSADGEPPMLVPTDTFRPGGVLGLRTFWQVEAPFDRDLLIFVHLLDASGGRPTQRDAPPWQGRFPTSSWRAGSLVVDANDVYLPPGMAPGEYRIFVGMYDPASGERPPVTRDGRPVPEGMVEVGRVQVTSDE